MTATTGPNEQVGAEVIAAEQERCRAVLASDRDALDVIISDDFSNQHSDGSFEDKEAFLTRCSSASHSTYSRDDLDIRLFGDVAVMRGEMHVNFPARADREARSIIQHALQVWVKKDGRWQLVAQQTANKASQ
jgi:ketosteroid isomerase-like protein